MYSLFPYLRQFTDVQRPSNLIDHRLLKARQIAFISSELHAAVICILIPAGTNECLDFHILIYRGIELC